MVRPGPASQTGRKRESSDLELEQNLSADMKKPKVDSEEDSSAVSNHGTEELKTRIKKYLEDNRSRKFVDIEQMSQELHYAYPEYNRRKLKVFKGQVDSAFKSLTEVLANKNALKKNKKAKSKDKNASEKQVEEIRIEDETTVKGSSMNKRMSSLYGSGNKKSEEGNTVSETNHIDDDDCEVIEDDDVTAEEATVKSNADQVIVESRSSSIEKENLTEFEKTQMKVKEMTDTLHKAATKPKISSLTPKARVPSKNLSSFMNTSIGTSPKVVEIEKNINDIIVNTKTSYYDIIDNSIKEVNANSQPSLPLGHQKETKLLSKQDAIPSPKPLTKKPTTKLNSAEKFTEIDLEEEIANKLTEKHIGKRSLNTPASKKRKKFEVSVQSSPSTFADFGGNEEVLCNICKLLVHLKHPEVYRKLGVTPPRGFLLHGPPGCGKTLLAHAIAGELELPLIKISAPEVVSGVSGESEQKLRELFDQAIASSPCVLFIDEIDSITPKRENAQREMERRIVAQLLSCLDDLGGNPECQVVVIGATNRPDSLDPALRRAGRFDREIALGIPDVKARRKILEVLCKDLRLESGTDFGYLALITPGYVGADLTSLTREAAMAAVNRVFGDFCPDAGTDLGTLLSWLRDTPPLEDSQLGGLCIEQGDWKEASKIVQPSAKREGFATVPDVTWADVGALENVREELQLAILAPVTHADQFNSLGLPQSSGVLLVGPPGCGKTLVAKAIANEAGINFISVKGPELLNMYVGESERAVRAVFQRAKNSRPCVIFFDEVDSLCPRRSSNSGDGGSSSRVVNQLLTEMDGVEGRAGVWIMAATNRPDILDTAVLRPGRLDKILYVGFPGPRDRVEILRALTKDGTRPSLGSGVSLKLVGEDKRCEGFSGADVGNLVREASMIALKESMRKGVNKGGIVVEKDHFERAFMVLRPSVGGRDRERYEAMGRKYGERSEVIEVSKETQKIQSESEVVNDGQSDNEVEMLEPESSFKEFRLDAAFDGKNNEEDRDLVTNGEVEQSATSSDTLVTDRDIVSVFDISIDDDKSNTPVTFENNKDDPEPNGMSFDKEDMSIKTLVQSDPEELPKKNFENLVGGKENNKTETDDFVLETFVSADDNLQLKSPKVDKSMKSSPNKSEAVQVRTPKISILTPERVNLSEISKHSYPSKQEIQTPGVKLRFLPDMVIRVKDTATVMGIAGKTGKIKSVKAGGEQVTVKVEGMSSTRIVMVDELETNLPEEGDKVKSLVWGSSTNVGEMVSLDEEDNAVVNYSGEQKTFLIDMLCKVEFG